MPLPSTLSKPSRWQIRDHLLELVMRDLEGPAGGPVEIIASKDFPAVRERYLVGCVAPRDIDLESETGGLDELGTAEAGDPEEPGADEKVAAKTYVPSSFGLSCTIDGRVTAVRLRATWGRYLKEDGKGPDGELMAVWKRHPVEGTSLAIALREGDLEPWQPNPDQPEVFVRAIARRLPHVSADGVRDWAVSLFLVNGQAPSKRNADERWLFQARLEIEGLEGEPIFVRRCLDRDWSKLDPLWSREQRMLEMAYRHEVEFACGHGVAVHADKAAEDSTRAVRITTVSLPAYEVPRTDVPDLADNEDLTGIEIDMKFLAEAADGPALAATLAPLPDAHGKWIKRERQRVSHPGEGLQPFAVEADAALDACEDARQRIQDGIDLLARDAQAADAFRFANRAMWLQRVRTLYAEARRRGEEADLDALDVPCNRSWRPFQLAFILLNLPSSTDPRHQHRSNSTEAVADLLWFPTGGGKTEAYLGLAAYVMGLRRLQGMVGDRDGRAGVAVLMRYTLRLLTLQQFQRASALICACETIRRESIEKGESGGSGRWGEEPFRIGLWVGSKTTPNRVEDAAEAIRSQRGNRDGFGLGYGSPAQLTTCPWCGCEVDAGRDIHVEGESKGRLRVITYCSDRLGRCPFSAAKSPGEGIPVMVVDEEIYRRLPTLLIATVDKFAQMAWRGETQMLFGQVNGWCPRHGYRSPSIDDSMSHPAKDGLPSVKSEARGRLRPPDLIIQDELHLISGPLGTLVGLYETAIDELCSWDLEGTRVRPKVIASTATIRQASDQIWSLFQRKAKVFPPQGLDAGDNFFAIQRPPSPQHPGRVYLGVCAPGRRLKKALIRVYTAFLAAAQYLYETRGLGQDVDPWMSLVGYFYSLRELGGMRRLVEDDIRSALRDTDKRGLAKRRPPEVQELTSRKKATDIPDLLDWLEVPFDPAEEERFKKGEKTKRKRRPLDVVLATNMISVGVDVKRLGLMVVAGQPKTTAEYIQASSRVGRSFPGIVCTVYNWARPRDLSHFECFEHYHATFYQHVEGLSVTPFSPRALDRGLTGVLVSLIREAGFDYNENKDARQLDRNHPLVRAALDAILNRESHVGDPHARADVRAMLQRRLDEWLNLIIRREGSQLGYVSERDGVTKGFLERPSLDPWSIWTCPNSLREVEPAAGLILDPRPIFVDAPIPGPVP